MNCRLSAVNSPGDPDSATCYFKVTHCAAQRFRLAF